MELIHKTTDKFEYVYLMGVPVVYACVHEPRLKFKSDDEYEYSATAFVDEDMMTKLMDDIKLNKELKQVGVDKNKKRNYKYPLSSQDEEGRDTYDAYEGMYGISLNCPSVTKAGKERKVKVIDVDKEPIAYNVGNGSICNLKLFAYRNQDDLLNVQLDTVQVVELIPYEDKSEDDVLAGADLPF